MGNYKLDIYCAIHTESHLYIKGRMLKARKTQSSKHDGYLVSLFKSLKRALSKEVKQHPIDIKYLDKSMMITTDWEGYFEVLNDVSPYDNFDEIQLKTYHKGQHINMTVPLTKYQGNKGQATITDIDDTLLVTRVRSLFKIRLVLNSIFVNPFKRKKTKDSCKFYKRLTASEDQTTPLFYISNSPWNMFSYILSFIQHNNFPKGQIILRDYGRQMLKRKKELYLRNKYLEIEKAFRVFPQKTFWLVGDSAEKDFSIYRLLYEKYPNRVKCIIIRRAGNKKNEARIEKQRKCLDIKVVLVNSFEEILDNPKQIGLD